MPVSANDQATCFVNKQSGFNSQLGLHAGVGYAVDHILGKDEERIRAPPSAPT